CHHASPALYPVPRATAGAPLGAVLSAVRRRNHRGHHGHGRVGAGCRQAPAAARLTLRSWSRSPKAVDGVESFAGAETFDEFLGGTDILVNQLPLTPDTTGILNSDTFGKLRRDRLQGGPVIVNAARGGHQREADIAQALGD